jgi:MFS transporter, FHS family, glucose/mannose:H+ symporter
LKADYNVLYAVPPVLKSKYVNIAEASPVRSASKGGQALAGFFLSGFLLALLGAILPAWGYHRDPANFIAAGNYFLVLALGIIVANRIATAVLARRGIAFLLVAGCVVSCAALLFLAAEPPPASNWDRAAGLLALGLGAGLINVALFHAISPRYQSDPAGTLTLGGVFYGLGCLAATLLVAGTFYAYTVPSILIFMAVVPGLFAGVYARTTFAPASAAPQRTMREALQDFRSPGAILFALLLFFQFANEWSIAGWLPIFLIRRVGLSPSGALTILAFYWFFLLTGRLVAVAVLPRVRHGRLLTGSMLSAIFGCVILFSTNNSFGAATGAFFVGAGFASIYPLVLEAIGRRFPYYHPGFFNGIFTFAQVGGLLAPATLGYAADIWGVGVVLGLPLVGTFMVMALLVLIWLESRVTGR